MDISLIATQIGSSSDERKALAILAEKDISKNIAEAINSKKARRRWFWELLQNAKDTVVDEPDRTVSVKLTYNESVVTFEHCGNPFKYTTDEMRFDDLTNLILPLSGKSDGKATGKFGTGFLSTHILSLKVGVDGIFLDEQGQYSSFSIVIDRTETERPKIINSIIRSLDERTRSLILISGNDYDPRKNDFQTTRLSYYLCHNRYGLDSAREIVKEGIDDLHQTLPYVLTFVPEIDSVEIIDTEITNTKTTFRKTKEESWKSIKITTITVSRWNLDNGNLNDTFVCIASLTDNEVEIAIEVFKENNTYKVVDFRNRYKALTEKEFPTLFSSFPLIGSEDFDFPLVINSKRFNPNETRDGIELKTNNYGNQTLIDKAVSLYREFLDIASKDWGNVYILAVTVRNAIPSNHDWIDKDWFEKGNNGSRGVLTPVREKILTTPLVDVMTSEGQIERKPIKTDNDDGAIFFPLRDNKNMLHKFGTGVFPNSVPVLADVENWCSVIGNDDRFERVSVESIIKKIANEKNIGNLAALLYRDDSKIDKALDWLSEFYVFVKTDFKDKAHSLLNYTTNNAPCKFIPDREGNFSSINCLKKDVGYNGEGEIDDELLIILNELSDENWGAKLLHRKFSDILSMNESLNEEQVANRIREIIESKLKDDVCTDGFKNAISKLYDWISRPTNTNKEYFTEMLKNRILSAIMPKEKATLVTRILELDRDEKFPLEKQVEILSLPDLVKIIELGKEALIIEQQKQVDFDFKYKIGTHIEKIVRDKIDNDLTSLMIGVEEQQGGQDIVVRRGEEIVYYIEVKSRWDKRNSITMSPLQMKNAVENQSKYSLCCVDMCDYGIGEDDRYNVPDITEIVERITVLPDIGLKVAPVLSGILAVEDIANEVSLTGDYRGMIPQSIVNQGITLDSFIISLIERISQ